MQKTLQELHNLQAQINSEWNNYRTALMQNKKFDEVKKIYEHIKELEKQIDLLMERANRISSGN